MIIAITGCIGSGKSYICNLIHNLYGYDTFSSDEFTRLAYEDEKVKRLLDKEFACLVNDKVDKQIIKSKLNDNNISTLNSIIHPFVKKEILKVKDQYINSLAFIEVPLLFESKMEILFDGSLVISVSDSLRYKRLKNRNVNAFQDMLKLEKYQLTNDEKVARATYILESVEDENENINNLDKIIQQIIKK